jgi:hypothetical protein
MGCHPASSFGTHENHANTFSGLFELNHYTKQE